MPVPTTLSTSVPTLLAMPVPGPPPLDWRWHRVALSFAQEPKSAAIHLAVFLQEDNCSIFSLEFTKILQAPNL